MKNYQCGFTKCASEQNRGENSFSAWLENYVGSFRRMGFYLDQIGTNGDKYDRGRNSHGQRIIDQLPVASRCEAGDDHGDVNRHPSYGGDWYVKSHQKILDQIAELFPETPLLGGEFLDEPTVGRVNWLGGGCGPDYHLFSYVYHEYLIFLFNHYGGLTTTEFEDPNKNTYTLSVLYWILETSIHAGMITPIGLSPESTLYPNRIGDSTWRTGHNRHNTAKCYQGRG